MHGIDATFSENSCASPSFGIHLTEEDRLLVVVEDVSEEQKLREQQARMRHVTATWCKT